MAECAEHIAVTENAIFNGIQKALKAPPEPEKKELVKGKDELVLSVVPDRSRKAMAPEPVRPTGRFADAAAVIAQFRANRARTIAFTRETSEDLRSRFFRHFALGDFDLYQWLLFAAAHSERHIAQMKEVKADPNFPGNR